MLKVILCYNINLSLKFKDDINRYDFLTLDLENTRRQFFYLRLPFSRYVHWKFHRR